MSGPRVLLDVDGVLADFCGHLLKLANAEFGTWHAPDDVTTYDIAEALGWDSEQEQIAFRKMRGQAADLPVFPGAIDGVRRLREVADVYVVTAPLGYCPRWSYDRTAWLYRHFGIFADRVIHTSAKHVVTGDVLIDDKTATLDAWAAEHPRGLPIQWVTPHNRRDNCVWTQADSWDRVIELVTVFLARMAP